MVKNNKCKYSYTSSHPLTLKMLMMPEIVIKNILTINKCTFHEKHVTYDGVVFADFYCQKM